MNPIFPRGHFWAESLHFHEKVYDIVFMVGSFHIFRVCPLLLCFMSSCIMYGNRQGRGGGGGFGPFIALCPKVEEWM